MLHIAIRSKQKNQSNINSRLSLSSAFIRFFNGFVDSEQKGLYATSVANLADSIGLPAWFTDLRHAGFFFNFFFVIF
jgi:hypothetical protein